MTVRRGDASGVSGYHVNCSRWFLQASRRSAARREARDFLPRRRRYGKNHRRPDIRGVSKRVRRVSAKDSQVALGEYIPGAASDDSTSNLA